MQSQVIAGQVAGSVALQRPGSFDRPGEPRTDHDGCRAGCQREGDVARVAHSAVSPHVSTGGASGERSLVDSRELRSPHGGHHARRAHRPRSDTDLDDVCTGRNQVVDAGAGDHVARHERNTEIESRHCSQRRQHPLLMSVRGIEDENIDTRGHERSSLARDVPVDSHGCRDDQATVSVNGGPVQRRAQGTPTRERADDLSVVHDADDLGVGGDDHVERVPSRLDVISVHRRGSSTGEIAQPSVREGRSESDSGDDALNVFDHETVGGLRDDHAVALRRGKQRSCVGNRRVGGKHQRGVPGSGLVLDPADRGVQLLQRQVLRKNAETAPARERRGKARTRDRVHVRRDQRDGGRGSIPR